MNIKTNITIGIGATEEKLKLAAIFFDQVIPIQKEHNIPKSLICQLPIDYENIDKAHKNDKKYVESDTQLLTENILPSYFESRTEICRDEVKEILHKVFNEGKNKANNVAILEIARQVNTSSLLGIPIFNESILLNKLIEDYKYNNVHKKVEIELLNAPIIDISMLDWLKIESAKKDPEFNIKAKRFGIFINKNYQGKDLNFIVDDLSIQIEDYKETCKKHGIELVNGTLKSLADSKSLFGTLGLVVCSLLFKTPEAALLSGTIGGVLEVLKINVTIKEFENKFNSFTKESPIALIHEIEKLKNSS